MSDSAKHSVKDDFVFFGNMRLSGTRRMKTARPIVIKILHIYVGETTKRTKYRYTAVWPAEVPFRDLTKKFSGEVLNWSSTWEIKEVK